MNFLLFHLQRLLMLPVQIFSSTKEMIGSVWNESGRSRALLLGLPSILIAIVGVGVLLWAKFGIANSLENRYLLRLEDSTEEKSALLVELRLELRMLRASQQAGSETTSSSNLIPEDDPRRVELETLRSHEKVYLEKLIDLNPEESEYLYRLALVAYERMEFNRCLALMNLTAPLDEPGYIKAHLWLANFYMGSRVKTQKEAMQNLNLALAHAEQCLKRDQGNIRARQIKATLLFAQKRDLDEAYEIFEELFQEEPRSYKPLVDINKELKRTDRDEAVLDSAIRRFEVQLKNELDIAARIQIHRDLTGCYLLAKQFAVAEQRLMEEIQRQSEMEQESGRVWAERALSGVYVAWSGSLDPNDPDAEKKSLELMKKAYRLDHRNSAVMRRLTRMGVSADPEVASEATGIYNGLLDPDAPASVLNEIGSQALSRRDYAAALRYFEMARQKSPRNPEILNNLAYAYLSGEEPNPKRGLTLVTEALSLLPNTIESRKYLTFFRDTRGQALMQLNKWTEAAADFEFALIDRPKDKEILEALIQCYRANGLDPSPYVERLRAVNEDDSADNPDQGVQTSGQ